MEDLIGGGSVDVRFAEFLSDWQSILDRRVAQVGAELAMVDGLAAAVLAGGHGRGEPWPLSDIDVILIAHPGTPDHVRTGVESIRIRLIGEWSAEGWFTGLDAGRLLFTTDEIDQVIGGVAPERTLDDLRWFHTMDKAFGGRALVEDASGRAGRLAGWATANRFDPAVVDERDARLREELFAMLASGRQAVAEGDPLRGTLALWRSVQLTQITLMGRWGLRDNSLGRFGSRFASAAQERGRVDLAPRLDALSDLDPASITRRGQVAPDWVLLRHDRSCRARRAAGDQVHVLADLRDTLRVCARYDAGRRSGPAIPEWLGIVTEPKDLLRRLDTVASMVDRRPSSEHG